MGDLGTMQRPQSVGDFGAEPCLCVPVHRMAVLPSFGEIFGDGGLRKFDDNDGLQVQKYDAVEADDEGVAFKVLHHSDLLADLG